MNERTPPLLFAAAPKSPLLREYAQCWSVCRTTGETAASSCDLPATTTFAMRLLCGEGGGVTTPPRRPYARPRRTFQRPVSPATPRQREIWRSSSGERRPWKYRQYHLRELRDEA